jgi:hypothetical protein
MRSDLQICHRTHFICTILIMMCVCKTLSTIVQILTDLPTVVVDCDTDVLEIILQQKIHVSESELHMSVPKGEIPPLH